MVSQIYKGLAVAVATLSVSAAASANCGTGLYCGQSGVSSVQPLSSWTTQTASGQFGADQYATNQFSPGQSSSTLSTAQADSTYGTGSISEAYSAGSAGNSYSFSSFSGSPSAITGLGPNESLQPTTCPVNVYDNDEGTVLGCYNVVKPVAQTAYYRVVRPVVYVRYPVPVAVPYTSPCHTVTSWSRYGDWGYGGRRGCR